MSKENVLPGQIYKHFKGNLYQIICIAHHSENNERLVVYQALYGEFGICARPYDMFVSLVDREKYPEVKQEYRFELVGNVNSANMFGDKKTTVENTTVEISAETVSALEDNDYVINPLLMDFLNSDTYQEKIDIMHQIKKKNMLDEVLLNDVAVSLDFVLPEGNIEEQYAAIKDCLKTYSRFDVGRRLR